MSKKSGLSTKRTQSVLTRMLILIIGSWSLATTQTGCQIERNLGEPVDYGPAVTNEVFSAALDKMLENSNPAATKEGAFVHFQTSDSLAGNSLFMLAADTGQTVISRTTSASKVTLKIFEISYSYRNNSSQPEKITRNFELDFSTTQKAPATTGAVAGENVIAWAAKRFEKEKGENPLKTSSPSASATKVTIHRLKYWEDLARPPSKVRNQPNCLGIPNCVLHLRHVKFDVVFWNKPEGNLMHFELITSPEVPQTSGINMSQLYSYFPGMVSHCVSFLTGVGADERNKILITECNDVINFAFEKPAATPSDQATEPTGTPDLTAPPSTP